jgi:mono/diheme cytochrome c family protein
MVMKFVAVMVVAGCVAVGTALQAQSGPAADGKKLYDEQKCANCHKIAGVGKLYPLDGVATKLKADDIRKWMTAPAEMEKKLAKKPTVTMSGWMKTKKFTPEQIDALVAYMLTLK